jgi:hypothetical protein
LIALLKSVLIRVKVYLNIFRTESLRRSEANPIAHGNNRIAAGFRIAAQDVIDGSVGLINGAKRLRVFASWLLPCASRERDRH